MGVSTKTVTIQSRGTVRHRLETELQPGRCCVAMSADTLLALYGATASASDVRQFLSETCQHLLVFGCSGSREQDAALSWLTAGFVCGIGQTEGPNTVISLPRKARALSRQLAGFHFSRPGSDAIPVFELRDEPSVSEVIVAANARPMFVRIDRGPGDLFLLAGPGFPDPDQPLRAGSQIEDQYDGLLPVLIFLRHCFASNCWHGPQATARIIVDDPLLIERYGFLDYDVLVKSMQRRNYGASIAFIPWNYWRTSRRSAARLISGSCNLSICIHGCDHTNKEFEAQAPAILQKMASVALQRMESHKRRIGAGYEPVMVFPQGRFSRAAMAALRGDNYLAAVNSTCFPADSGVDDPTLGDLLRPAVTRYNGFPLFQRRYPRRLFDLAFDLFLGKPALVVEHHQYFREGVQRLEELVAALYELQPDLTWPDLTTQLSRSCQIRNLENGSTEVRFFTRRFQLIPREAGTGRFLLSKHEPDSAAVQAVLVDGEGVPFFFEKGFLKLEVLAQPCQVRDIEVVDQRNSDARVNGFGIIHNARVFVRRGLSEFRDNTLSRHSALLKTAARVARGLKVTGDS